MASIKTLAQRLLDGDKTALDEIRHLKGHDAQTLLDLVRKNRDAYRKAAAVILEGYGKR